MSETIKTLLKEVLKNEYAQSILKAFETPFLPIKILLFAFVITTTVLSSFLTLRSIMSYFDYEVITNIRTMHDTFAIFPKITICNVNPFTTEESVVFLKSINKKINSSIDMFDTTQTINLNSREKADLFKKIYVAALEEMNSKNFDLNKRLNFTHSLDNTLHSCAFNHVQCTSKDFVKRQIKMKGTCYVFNSGVDSTSSLKISAFPGQSHQFQMELYVNFHESLSEFTSYMGSALGAFIRIENSSYSSSNVGTDWIQIESGKRTFISIDRVLKYDF